MPRTRPVRLVPLLGLCLAVLALVNSGCLLAVAGLTAAGTAGYLVYEHGELSHSYDANFNDVLSAVRSSLTELGMPASSEKATDRDANLTARTAEGERVEIQLDTSSGRTPAEGPVTRIAVRIGTWGDKVQSTRILDQVSSHLAYNRPGAAPLTPIPTGTLGPIVPVGATVPAGPPPQTPPPPIAGP